MTALSTLLGATTLLAASSKKSSSSSSSELSLIVIVGLFAVVYFFFLRPRQQRARERTTRGRSFGIGDEVMSVGGIYGHVVGLGDDSVDVEVAPGIVLTFLRRAVNPRPGGAASGRGGPRAGVPERTSGPYGASADQAPSSPSTEFGASSGHFDDPDRSDTGQPGSAEAGWDEEEAGEDDDWDFDDEEAGGEEAGDDEAEDAGEVEDEDEDAEEEPDPQGSGLHEHGRAGERDRDANGGPSSSAPDGSATGTPRTTGGPSSEED